MTKDRIVVIRTKTWLDSGSEDLQNEPVFVTVTTMPLDFWKNDVVGAIQFTLTQALKGIKEKGLQISAQAAKRGSEVERHGSS